MKSIKTKTLGLALLVVVGVIVGVVSLTSPVNPPVIAVVLPSDRNPFWVAVRSGAEAAAAEAGDRYRVVIRASQDQDPNSQNDIMGRFLMTSDVAALVLGPASGKHVVGTVAEYSRREIPVILIDTMLDETELERHGGNWTAFRGSNNRLGGKIAGEELVARAAEKDGVILLVNGNPVHQSAVDRREGFLDAFVGSEREIIEIPAQWSPSEASDAVFFHATTKEIAGIFCANDDMALGAVAGLKAANLRPKTPEWPVIIGFDATINGLRAIAQEEMSATVEQQAVRMGRAGVNAAIAVLENDPGFQRITLFDVTLVPE